jgi:hypothetical protein
MVSGLTKAWARAREPAARARAAWESASPSERAYGIVLALVVVLGLLLRLRNAGQPLWLDEADWTVELLNSSPIDATIRPVGFMWLTKGLALALGPSELVLRSLPLAAGLSVTVLAVPLARHLFTARAARLLFVSVLALHPAAIDLSKEFKPYSVSLMLHLLLALLVLRYQARGRTRDLALFLGVACAACGFAQDIVLAYPGLFLLSGYRALGRSRGHVVATTLTVGVLIAALMLQYFLIWSRLPADESAYWGKKYRVFFDPSGQTYLEWLFGRATGIVSFAGYRRTSWDSPWLSSGGGALVSRLDEAAWAALFIVGVCLMGWRRRARDALLLVLPLVVMWVLNLLGKWPLGVFRTNLFLVFYTAAIACAALDFRVVATLRFAALLPAALLVFLPLPLFERRWHATKGTMSQTSDGALVMSELLAMQRRSGPARVTVVAEPYVCSPLQYYANLHPVTSGRPGKRFKKAFSVQCTTKGLSALHRRKASVPRLLVAVRRSRSDTVTSRAHGYTIARRVDLGTTSLFELVSNDPALGERHRTTAHKARSARER